MEKLLECYPFADPRIRLVEGFKAYDGVLGDEPGKPHKGIDYVLKEGGAYVPFEVFAMHDGIAFQGLSDSWGLFVIIYILIDGKRFSTVYAHLAQLAVHIAPIKIEKDGQQVTNEQGTLVRMGQKLGLAGTTGWTEGNIQLHVELHERIPDSPVPNKHDPYGLDDVASSGRYPQPGASLAGLNHAWITDAPPLATA